MYGCFCEDMSEPGSTVRKKGIRKEIRKGNQERKESGMEKSFKKGFGVGLLTGIMVMAVTAVGGILIYTAASNDYLVIGGKGVYKAPESEILDQKTVNKVEQLTRYMDLYYYKDYDRESVQTSLISGLMDGLEDPYSVYYTPEEYEDLQVTTNGNYYGIGAGLSQDKDTMTVTIVKVYEGTPAEEAGLKKEDVILSVNDVDAATMEVSKLVEMIRGEEGTTVHLKIYRESTEETLDMDVERRDVQLPSVSSQMLENGIGYIQIAEFRTNTAEQFEKMLADLQKAGMKSLIVDVRSNPGGLLSSVVRILDDLLPKGTVVYTQDKYGEKEVFTSDASCVDFPIAVLMDKNSASASEIFAGAIKDYHYGTLVGTTTFGKGIVQSLYPLGDGDALKITTSRYYTPNGNYIHEVGISPDIELEYEYLGPKDAEYEMKYDNQLQKAIEVLKETERE